MFSRATRRALNFRQPLSYVRRQSHQVSNNGSSNNPHPPRKRLDVAIVGAPNAGKSQLLNVLTNSPVAAVSRKRHTTRGEILGVRTVGDTQIVFKDTPGYLTESRAREEKLDQSLISNSVTELEDVDFTLLVVDAAKMLTDKDRHSLVQLMRYAMRSKGRIEEEVFDPEPGDDDDSTTLEDDRPKFAIVLNKVDLVKPKTKLLDIAIEIGELADECLIGQADEMPDFETMLKLAPTCFYVSALKEIGTDELLDDLLGLSTPCRVWAVEEGQSTTMAPEEQIIELIREKIYRCLHREVPHSIHQVNSLFRRLPQGMIIHQDLVVYSKSHQKLVQGSAGRTLQRIQDSATRDLSKLFGCDVVLQLKVKLNKSKQRRTAEDATNEGIEKFREN
jgi:GTP-binding protein Era